jgi:hypothetical protein
MKKIIGQFWLFVFVNVISIQAYAFQARLTGQQIHDLQDLFQALEYQELILVDCEVPNPSLDEVVDCDVDLMDVAKNHQQYAHIGIHQQTTGETILRIFDAKSSIQKATQGFFSFTGWSSAHEVKDLAGDIYQKMNSVPSKIKDGSKIRLTSIGGHLNILGQLSFNHGYCPDCNQIPTPACGGTFFGHKAQFKCGCHCQSLKPHCQSGTVYVHGKKCHSAQMAGYLIEIKLSKFGNPPLPKKIISKK